MARAIRPVLAAALLGVSACGDPLGGRQAVSGGVTFQGKPLGRGTILFLPATPGLPTQSGAAIADGRYSIPRSQGLVPGRYKVAISSPDGRSPDAGGDALPGPSGNFASKDRIPPAYNLDSKEEVEVTRGGPNRFDYKVP
ncbi:MAG: hypothetical protein U0797_16505 [Gemmataceae bacterium]